jgi:hypothetical protein
VTLKKQWVDMMQRAAKDVPFAVRFCPVCGENLATPLRFRDHLEGRKHCENVLVRVVVSGEVQMGDELTEADAFRLHREYCTFEKPEPPDVAMMMLTAAFDEIKEKRGHVSVPAGFRAELCFSFNVEKHRIRQVVCEFFHRCKFGEFRGGAEVEHFVPLENVFRNFDARQVVYNAVKEDRELLTCYEELVLQVVIPHLKQMMETVEGKPTREIVFHYQFPPTLRIQPGPSKEFGKRHCDFEYGHQDGVRPFFFFLWFFFLTRLFRKSIFGCPFLWEPQLCLLKAARTRAISTHFLSSTDRLRNFLERNADIRLRQTKPI